jgi:hypothetical protein
MKSPLRAAAAWLLLTAVVWPAFAVVKYAPLSGMTAKADAIVQGRVLGIRSEWTPDRSLIVTVVSVEVREVLKGRPAPLLLVQVPGGVVGEIGLRVSDTPAFAPDEEVVLFLRAVRNPAPSRSAYAVVLNPAASYEVLEWAQGKYAVDSRGLARRDGFSLLPGASDPERELSLAGLKTAIRASLKSPSSGRVR